MSTEACAIGSFLLISFYCFHFFSSGGVPMLFPAVASTTLTTPSDKVLDLKIIEAGVLISLSIWQLSVCYS